MNVSRLELVAQFAPSGKRQISTVVDRSSGVLACFCVRAVLRRFICRVNLVHTHGRTHVLSASPYWLVTGTSVKNVAHWAQAIRKSRLREHPLFQM